MTTYQAWVFLRALLRDRYLRGLARGSPNRLYPRLRNAVAVLDAALGYADGVSAGKVSHLYAWRVCRQVAMRFASRVPSPIELRQKPFNFKLREAVDVLDQGFGFDAGIRPYECRYHGRLAREAIAFGVINGVYTEQCPKCHSEAFPVLC